jgi:DNA invertase Pin-like site-specific DNA recombinase
MTAKLLRVALYARVSTKDKGQDVELQLNPLRAWAAAHGADRATEYTDEASAGDLRGRVNWRRLLDDARTGRLNVVVVWKLDRAFRSSQAASNTLAELRDLGVDFVSVTQPIDTTTPTGRLVYAILAAVAEMEHDLIVDRVTEGMANARRKGVRIGRPSGTDRPGFDRDLLAVRAEIVAGTLSARAAAIRLKVGPTTLKRLLEDA